MAKLGNLSCGVSEMKRTTGVQSASPTRNTLHYAVLGGNADIVKAVHASLPALANETDQWGFTPLALACALQHQGMVEALLGERVTGVEVARASGRGRLVNERWMLGPPPLVLSKTKCGLTPLMVAVRWRVRLVLCSIPR